MNVLTESPGAKRWHLDANIVGVANELNVLTESHASGRERGASQDANETNAVSEVSVLTEI
ncbi:MAG: hypothetical protein ACQEQJ_05030 [Halobacteriota archaeon]